MTTRVPWISDLSIQTLIARRKAQTVVRIVAGIIAATLISSAAQAARSRPLNEDAALAFLERTLKSDGVYAKRISLDCIAYDTEEKSHAYFQFAVREIHNGKCGGDPDTSPVVDRYRVYRRSRKIQWWQAAEDKWQPYDAATIR